MKNNKEKLKRIIEKGRQFCLAYAKKYDLSFDETLDMAIDLKIVKNTIFNLFDIEYKNYGKEQDVK